MLLIALHINKKVTEKFSFEKFEGFGQKTHDFPQRFLK